MNLEIFINFNGNCREAVEFYAKVFRTEARNWMTFGQMPADSGYAVKEAEKDKIAYVDMKIGESTVMFMDMSEDFPVKFGNNISPTINVTEKEEVTRLFNELKDGGKVFQEPAKMFFSELYAMVEDKFGVIWQILYYAAK